MMLAPLHAFERFFHGIGLHLGYQALLGSLKGDLPASSMLTLGFSYWMG